MHYLYCWNFERRMWHPVLSWKLWFIYIIIMLRKRGVTIHGRTTWCTLSECLQGWSSGTCSPLCWRATTWRANSKKAATTSAGARGMIAVGGRGTVWTYSYFLSTRSGKWCTILCLSAMIHPEYQHTCWKGVTSHRCSYDIQVTWQCSIESNKPLKWSECLNPLWGFHLPTYGFSRS